MVSPHTAGELTIACIENLDAATWPHVDATCKSVGKNSSGGAFAATQGTVRPSEAVTPWRCLQQGLVAARLPGEVVP